MAKQQEMSKSEAIRDFKQKNPDAGPKAIAEALGKDGYKVTAGFVSTVLSNDKRKGGTTGGAKRRSGATRRPSQARASNGSTGSDALVSFAAAVKEVGGVDNARQMLDTLEALLSD